MKIYKLAIISPETAELLNIDVNLPQDEIFKRAVENTKGTKITDKGLEIDLIRNQHPDQGGQYSIRSGVFYQPQGSHNKYPYRGKSGYGGQETIRGKTLLKKPIFVKGATGGKAPQMAYDLINGKGAYQSMRTEVLDKTSYYAIGTHGTYDLLKKYGGDVNLSEEIERIGKMAGGNNWAYAIQENIVANSIRKAGYDSVVGWSSKRDGTPFLSEIFDVREITYPNSRNTEGEVHETLLKREKN